MLRGYLMVYGELGNEALTWATRFIFGLDPASMPARVVITPYKVETYFRDFQAQIGGRELKSEKIGENFLVGKGKRQTLFCEGGIGASSFADTSYTLCHCRNVEEIIFVGTGGGIGKNVETTDISLPTSCIRLDKVLEIMLPPEAPAKADLGVIKKLKNLLEREVQSLGIKVHSGTHATVPFFLSETKQLLTNLKKQGALSVDMELSVLYALANHYHKKAAGIIRIGDTPLKGLPTWKSRSNKVELKKEIHKKILNAVTDYPFTQP
jgi:purine-nucleoside phosphorylase